MRRLFLTLLFSFVGSIAWADHHVLLSDQTHKLYIEVSPDTVKQADTGFSKKYLKILIPQLAELTVLNHRDEGDDAPVLANWVLADPAAIHEGRNEVRVLDVEVKLTKILDPDPEGKFCQVTLKEEVRTLIGNQLFTNVRLNAVASRKYDDCR